MASDARPIDVACKADMDRVTGLGLDIDRKRLVTPVSARDDRQKRVQVINKAFSSQ